MIVRKLALAVDRDDFGISIEVGNFRRSEIKHRPARGIGDRTAQRLRQARPRQSNLQHGILEMQRGQPRGAERPVLLLRMLQDQQRCPALDRRDAVADAQRQWLGAMRAICDCFDGFGLV